MWSWFRSTKSHRHFLFSSPSLLSHHAALKSISMASSFASLSLFFFHTVFFLFKMLNIF